VSKLTFRSFISTYHGLPRTLRDQDIDTDMPASVSHDQITTEKIAFPLPGEASEMDSALLFFRLAKIMGATLESLYTTTRRRGGVQKIARLQGELDLWTRDVDSYRQSNAADDDRKDYPLQGKVFLRYIHYIVVLHVHRPALTFDKSHPQFQDSLRRSATAAEHILDILTTKQIDELGVLVYPSGLHVIWQAALLLLYNSWISDSGPNSKFVSLVTASIEFLRLFAPNDDLIQSCTRTLESLLLQSSRHNGDQTGQDAVEQVNWNLFDWGSSSALDMTNDLAAIPFQFEPTGDLTFSNTWWT
jgi:hypothetical protein